MVRYLFENPFINHECVQSGLEKAPIPTNICETYAQCNEDLMVESLLRALMRRSGRDMRSVRYAEIGANHPVQTSATYLLYRLYGASGILVEANPGLIANLQKQRPNDIVVNCAITAQDAGLVEIFVHEKNELTSMSLDHIANFQALGGTDQVVEKIAVESMGINRFLAKYFGDRLDFMSVDVEGYDLEVIQAMDPVFQPSIIQCEHELKVDAFDAVFNAKGYRLAMLTDVNAIYVRSGII
ncbi:MAG TPA: FkbM family methyltransferase [Roseiarcus sp.]